MIADVTVSRQEASRLAALEDLELLDTPAEQAYDDITELAAFICGTPVSLVSLVGPDKQFFKSAHNFPLQETSRDLSFCAHTLVTGQTLVVEDASRDERFAENALVTGDPNIRFYAGAPIVSNEGHVFGTVCVIDNHPRSLSKEQLAALERLARQASRLLHSQGLSLKTARLERESLAKREEAERNQKRMQLSLDAAEVATWFYDPGRNVVGGDARMAKFFGLDSPEGPAEIWLAAIVEDDRNRVAEEFAASLTGEPYDTRYRVQVDGHIRWLHARARVASHEAGQARMLGICEDVTREESLAATLKTTQIRLKNERGVAAERLHLESERLQLSLMTSNATSFDWNPVTDEVKWGGLPPFGLDPETIPTGASSFDYVHPDDRAGLGQALSEAMESGNAYAYEYRALWADGSTRWIRTAGRALKLRDASTRFLGVNSDITDRKLAEQSLLHTEKITAVGRLASVISHEINNPLEAVINLLYIVRASPTLTRDDREHLEQADRELARVSQITSETLRVHRSVGLPVEIDADVLIQGLLSLYRTRLTASHIRTRLDLEEGVFFEAYEGDVRQVLNTLIGNAFDAMRNGGFLSIRTRCATDPRTGQKGVGISVSDTGSGITPEARGRIFEAFYSTKGINGTGLGLWIAKRVLHKHKGHLTFRSSTGARHGSVFRLWLPLKAAPTASEALV